MRLGVHLHPQHTSVEDLRRAWRMADDALDSVWTWDHFFPNYGDEDGSHFEGWTLLAAMAADTSSAQIGVLVTSVSYRNPDLLADMARTTSHLSGGRLALGLGSGWFERDYREYGYEYMSVQSRLADLESSIARIRARLAKLRPPAVDMPLLIGGGGERVVLRIVAEHADMWNLMTHDPGEYARKNEVLDEWCRRVGRDPAEIQRTALTGVHNVERLGEYEAAGAEHVIFQLAHPFDLEPVLAARTGARA